jgi:hypothetical protein
VRGSALPGFLRHEQVSHYGIEILNFVQGNCYASKLNRIYFPTIIHSAKFLVLELSIAIFFIPNLFSGNCSVTEKDVSGSMPGLCWPLCRSQKVVFPVRSRKAEMVPTNKTEEFFVVRRRAV